MALKNETLGQNDFSSLQEDDSGAFLLLKDATHDIQEKYKNSGLVDDKGSRRIVRVVTLPEGFRLFKLQKQNSLRDTLSPWWSSVLPFEEEELGAAGVFKTSLLNGVSMRELVRFMSAVPLDWNSLDYYVEVELIQEIKAFWGQFTPQVSIQEPNKKISGVSVKGNRRDDDLTVTYSPSSDAVYLPDILGGCGTWQLYIKNFLKTDVTTRTHFISSTHNEELSQYFQVTPEEMNCLLNQRTEWLEHSAKS